jgi:hypothetical protein
MKAQLLVPVLPQQLVRMCFVVVEKSHERRPISEEVEMLERPIQCFATVPNARESFMSSHIDRVPSVDERGRSLEKLNGFRVEIVSIIEEGYDGARIYESGAFVDR